MQQSKHFHVSKARTPMICHEHLYPYGACLLLLLFLGSARFSEICQPLSVHPFRRPRADLRSHQASAHPTCGKRPGNVGIVEDCPQNKTPAFFMSGPCEWPVHCFKILGNHILCVVIALGGMDETWDKWLTYVSSAKGISKLFILIRRCAAATARCASALNLKILSTLNSTWSLTM